MRISGKNIMNMDPSLESFPPLHPSQLARISSPLAFTQREERLGEKY
jgi:hypothetical protein